MKICPRCGRSNSNNSTYCENCRTKLTGETESGASKTKIMTMIAGVLAIVLVIGGVSLLILSKSPSNNTTASSYATTVTEPVPVPEPEPEPLPKPEPEPVPAQGHTYGFYDAKQYGLDSYQEVADFCVEQGGHLAVINDQSENNYLFGLVRDNFANTAFFGYSDEWEEGNWWWYGDSSNYENWTTHSQHQPDNGSGYGGDEDYAEFNYERNTPSPNDGTWNDAPFRDNTDRFICEWEFDVEEAQK